MLKVGTKVRVKKGKNIPSECRGRMGVVKEVYNDGGVNPISVNVMIPSRYDFNEDELEVIAEETLKSNDI